MFRRSRISHIVIYHKTFRNNFMVPLLLVYLTMDNGQSTMVSLTIRYGFKC